MAEFFSFTCSCCGKLHEGSPSFAYRAPDPYMQQPIETQEKGKLDSDLCMYEDEDGPHFFIRTVLEIAIQGVQEPFTWGVWVSVSEKSFNHYVENYTKPSLAHGYFGYLCNSLPYYENTYALHADVKVQLDGQRPTLILHDSDQCLVSDFDVESALKKRKKSLSFVCTGA